MTMENDANFAEFMYQLECEAAETAAKQKKSADELHQLPVEAAAATSSESQTAPLVDPQDGTVYEWNEKLQGMFPKVSDELDVLFKAQYGSSEVEESSESNKVDSNKRTVHADANDVPSDEPPNKKTKPENRPADWFEVDDSHNHNVYVSSLPLDITNDEFAEVMSKAGIIMKDPRTGQLKLKLYVHADGSFKGDGLCCYLKIESVELALKVLDGYQLRDHSLQVERAKFQQKGEFDKMKQRLRRLKATDKKKLKKQEDKLLAWQPERLRGQRANSERTVVLKNMFDPLEFRADPTLHKEYEEDLRAECTPFGTVKKVVVYERHHEGVATVSFDTAEQADKCIGRMHGRWFNQKQLTAEAWDGKTKYKVEETAQEAAERIEQWEKLLDNEDLSTATSTSPRLAAIINPEFSSVEHIKQLEIVHEHHHPAFHDSAEVAPANVVENDIVTVVPSNAGTEEHGA